MLKSSPESWVFRPTAFFCGFSCLAACLACWLALPAAPALAADGTWNLDNAGNWSTAGNWLGGAPGSTTGTTSTDTAWFSRLLTGARTVTVDSNRNIRNITFDAGNSSTFGYNLSGGSLLLTSGGTISSTGNAGAHTDTISAPMTILGNNATYTISNDSTLATRLLSISGAITGQSTTGGTTTLILGGNNTTSGTSNSFSSTLSAGSGGGAIAVVKEGSGTWRILSPTLERTNEVASWTINGGTLLVPTENQTKNALGSAPAIAFANVAGAQLDFGTGNQNRNIVFGSLSGGGANGGNIVNAGYANSGIFIGYDNTSTTFGGRFIAGQAGGGINKVGTGTLTLTGSGNDAGGTTQINGGAIGLDFSQAWTGTDILASTRAIQFGGGRLLLTGSSGASNSQTFASTTLNAGNNGISLTSNSATGLVVNLGAITRSAGGTLDITLPGGTQSTTNGVRTTSTTVTNGVTTNSTTAYLTVGGTTWGVTSGTNVAGLSSYATGASNYTSTNNVDVTNGDTISTGTVNTLRFNGNNTLNLSGTTTIGAGGVLVTSAASAGATFSGGTLRPGGGNELVLINNGGQLTVGSVIANNSAAAALTLSGTGNFRLNGNNTYTGATRITSSTVSLGSATALGASGSSAVWIGDHPTAALDLNGFDISIGSLAGAGGSLSNIANSANTAGGRVIMGANSLTAGADNTTTTYGGRVSGSGTFTKVGTGNMTFSGSSAFAGFSGSLVVENGTLTVGSVADTQFGTEPLGTATVYLGKIGGGTANNLRLDVTGSTGRPIVLVTGNSGTMTIGQTPSSRSASSTVVSGSITGAGELLILRDQQTASFSLPGLINHTGNLTLRKAINSSSVFTTTGTIGSNVLNVTLENVNHNDAAGINLGGMIQSSGTISNIGARGVTISGTITNAARLVQNGAGTLTVNGVNTFTGDTLVQAGTLALGNNLALQNSGLDTSGAGAINATGYTTPTFGGLIGSKDISSVITTGYSSITALTLNPQSGKSYTYSGNIGNGATGMTLTKSGSGTQILSGSNSYSGATTVSLGVLRVDSANALPGGIGATGGSSALTINGGVIGLGNGDFNRGLGTGATQVQITGGGGFAAYGDNRIVNLGGASGTATWGSNNFISAGSGTGTFILGAADANRMVTFQNPIDLGNAARTVQVDNGSADVDATLSGVLSSVAAGNGLTKSGAGTLDLTAANSFNGTLAVQNGTVRFTSLAAAGSAQNLGAGTLVNLGVASTSSGELDYRGSGGTLDKNITALGNGRNRIRNSGAGTLTLSGTLTKNGTILELAGGTFTVSGRITGANANSDLFVNGAAVTLSSTNNDYNGPTYVYNNGSITLGASNVIPNNSALLLGGTGSDTGIGTINTGTFTDTIASLTSSSLGSTIGITINGATAGGLTTTGNLTFGAGTDTLNLSLTSLSAGRYQLLTYQGTRSGTFDAVNITNPDSRYNLVYGGATNSSIDLQMKANQASTFTLNPAASRVLVGGSTQLSGLLANSSPTGAAALAWSPVSTGSLTANGFTSSLGSTIAAGSTSSITAWLSAGNTAGTQNWSITNTDNNAITTVSTATGSIDVVDQRVFTSPSTINLGRVLLGSVQSGTATVTSSGSFTTTASSTLGTTSGSFNGLSFTGGNVLFNSATNSAAYTLGGTVNGTAGNAIGGSFNLSATDEFGNTITNAATVAFTGTAVNQRSFSVSNSGTISLGNFLRTGSVTGSTTISSIGLNATTANATLGSFNGTNTNGFSLGLATGTNFFNGGSALQEAVYSLSGSATSAGVINGSFSSNVSAELGAIDPVAVSLVGTAYAPAIASFTTPSTTTSWLVDIGEFNQNTGDHTKGFSIFNLFNDPTYTADLRLLSITDIGTPSGSLTIDLTPALFGDLLAGGTSNWLASLSSASTGMFSNQYQLNFVSAKNGQSLGGPQSMTLTVTGIIVVPEPGALALAGIGIAAAAYAFRRRRS